MADERPTKRYRRWYARLLRLYPKSHQERFGQGMEQTFHDLLREREAGGRGLSSCALWMFIETFTGIIREDTAFIMARSKNIVRIALATGLLLLAPLVAMQFTGEVAWSLFDFALMGALLFGTGLAYELVARKSGNIAYRAAVGLAVVTALLLVWSNLAVGIIGSENNPANLMYFGALAVGIIGAIVARFKPHGMARALFATVLAQALATVVALMIGLPQATPVEELLGVNALFALPFVGSALLFRRAARQIKGPELEPTA